MIALVRKLKVLSNVKMCVSSRPWNEFEQAFGRGGAYKLCMQDFNEGDIREYVNDTLTSDPNHQEHEDRDTLGRLITNSIVYRSGGVFLWVFLVVRSFQEGLRNGDSIARFRARLAKLPQDLNKYFEKIIFHDIPDSYHSVSADMFRVAMAAGRSLPLYTHWFIGERDAEHQISRVETLRLLTPDKLKRRLETGLKRLSACCKGLLEIQHDIRHLPLATTATPPTFSHEVLLGVEVGFMHRTMHDFLATEET